MKSRKADIPIYLVFTLIITLAAIMLLFVLISGKTELGKTIYCKTIDQARVAVWKKTSDPQCSGKQSLETNVIRIDEEVNETIVYYILECWKKSSYANEPDSMLCEEVVVTDKVMLDNPITEKEVTDIIMGREIRHILANSVDDQTGDPFDCGEENSIRFIDSIHNEENVLIEYDSASSQIVVS